MNMQRAIMCLCVMVLSVATATSGAEKKPVTNADVVTMIKAGLSETTIIMAIKQGPSDFDTSPMALIELKKQAVTDDMLQAMMQTQPQTNWQGHANVTQAGEDVQQKTRTSPSSGMTADQTTTGEYVVGKTTNAASAHSFSSKGKVWLPDGDNLIQVNSVAGYSESSVGQGFRLSFTGRAGFSIYANGTQAKIRLKTSPAVIYTRHTPSESGVTLLTVDGNKRSIWVETKVGSNQGEFSPEENDMKFDEEMIEDDIYKLTFRKPLKPGEYGLITPGGSTKYLIYDFAVEP